MTAPKVSVCITAYNHEDYIAQALDSVLAQKTDFAFEVLVGEDDSEDRTRSIVCSYSKRFPEHVRALLNERANVIYIEGHPTGRWNLVNNLKQARGDYVALLDGDDYWTDPNKLQLQVDLMEAHPACSFTFHNAWCEAWPTGERSEFSGPGGRFSQIDKLVETPAGQCAEITLQELFFRWVVPTASMLFRRSALPDLPDWFFSAISGDHALQLLLAENGNALYLNRHMSVWRRHAEGLTKNCTGLRYRRNWARMHHNFNVSCQHAYDLDLGPQIAAELRTSARERENGQFKPLDMLKDQHLSNLYRRRLGNFSMLDEARAWAGWLRSFLLNSIG